MRTVAATAGNHEPSPFKLGQDAPRAKRDCDKGVEKVTYIGGQPQETGHGRPSAHALLAAEAGAGTGGNMHQHRRLLTHDRLQSCHQG
jgi:hypothetical protein